MKVFKFWFADLIQDGAHYQDELFCRLATYPLNERAAAYQLSSRIGHKGYRVLLSVNDAECSLWGALREPMTHAILRGDVLLELHTTPTVHQPAPESSLTESYS
ncbi:MAG: hypothetical protein ACO4AI_06020 [Prochlorothrix sp.]|nr:hypothetical protein [Prochlorothrix sp.]